MYVIRQKQYVLTRATLQDTALDTWHDLQGLKERLANRKIGMTHSWRHIKADNLVSKIRDIHKQL